MRADVPANQAVESHDRGTVSVVIPTHNRAHTLERALTSVWSQTRKPDEVILVDDGSTDGTERLVRGCFPETVYLRQPNLGVSAARNLGIRSARGEWLAFLDSDDAWLPAKLEVQLAALEHEPALHLCHTEELWIRDGRRVTPQRKHGKSGGHIFRRCLPLCVISPSSVVIRRSLLEQVGLFDELLPACEDYDLWLRICARHPVAFVPEPQIVKFGGHDDQLSRRFWGMDRFRVQALEKVIADPALSAGDREAAASVLVEKAAILALGARKRDRHDRAAYYEGIRRRYLRLCPQRAGSRC